MPNDIFGLIHGKAGVITLKDGKKTSFIGSVNETYAAWELNYEILWEDDSQAVSYTHLINGATDEKVKKLREFQQKIFDLADKQITEWGIEHNEACLLYTSRCV